MAVKPIPDGYHSVTPYLIAPDAARLMKFLEEAFDAKERFRMDRPDGKIGHAELQIGDSVLMLADAAGEWQATASTIHLYVEDADATYRRAVSAGGASVRELATQFYGDRSGGVKDPAGNTWWISTHVEDVPPDELAKRAEAWMKQNS